MKIKIVLFVLAASLLSWQSKAAGEITVLSAGAIEGALRPAATAFETKTGNTVKLSFETTPKIRERVGAGESYDVVIATPEALNDFAGAGKLGKERIEIGRIGMGVGVRDGAPSPDISSVAALKSSMLSAEGLIITRGSSGLFFEGLLKKLGVYDQVDSKLTRFPDGPSAFEHMAKAKDHELSFGPVTEIRLYGGKGVRLVGPLPAEIQNYTSYAAAPMAGRPDAAAAAAFVRFLGSPEGKAFFTATGVE